MSSPFQQLGPRLRDRRLARGLTQHQVSLLVGLQGNAYPRIERGLSTPGTGTLLALCEVLGFHDVAVPLRALLGPRTVGDDQADDLDEPAPLTRCAACPHLLGLGRTAAGLELCSSCALVTVGAGA